MERTAVFTNKLGDNEYIIACSCLKESKILPEQYRRILLPKLNDV